MSKEKANNIRISAIVCTLLALMIVVLIWYIAQPAWNLRSDGFWWFVFGCSMVFLVFAIVEGFYSDFNCRDIPVTKFHFFLFFLPAPILIWIIIGALIGAPINNSTTYRDVVSIEERDFAEDFDDSCFIDNAVFMDLDTAQRLGDRVLGSVPNASLYEIDKEYNLILYNGRQYRISPLKYGDLFKYWKGKENGIPGYVLVDCETGEASFVKTENPIRYSTSAYFSYDLKRHLRSQYPDFVFSSHFMEIDDEGTPYWVTAVSEPLAGVWGARKVVGFILTKACSGESKYHELNDKPEWLDHVQSLNYLMEVVNWHFRYVNGWWNPSSNGVLRTTYSYAGSNTKKDEPNFYGYTSFVKDGNVMIFTGVTPVNRTESNVGFLIINASTGEYQYYAIPGAEESSAQSVVEGLIQNMGYQATFPFMINVAGRPTYLMNMKDKSGLIQRVAMVEYENYSHAFVGKDFQETLEGYLDEVGENSSLIYEDIHGSLETVDGEILNIYEAIIDGTTYYYYIIGDEVFKASILVNELQVFFNVGDEVYIEYYSGQNYNNVKEIRRN